MKAKKYWTLIVYSFFIVVLLLSFSGCTCLSAETNTIPKGTLINIVQAEFGLPDVISDESGDLKRLYVPHNRPPYEWPPSAPRTFYYLDRDLQVVFIRGKVVSVNPIEAERRKILERMLAEDGKAGVEQKQ